MSCDPICVVEQIKENKMFLRSANNRYHFWVDPSSGEDWSLIDIENQSQESVVGVMLLTLILN